MSIFCKGIFLLKEKDAEWETIAIAYSAQVDVKRNGKQLRALWDNLKKCLRKKMALENILYTLLL
jgi:hypothetical protein